MTTRQAVVRAHQAGNVDADLAAHEAARHAHDYSAVVDACGDVEGRRYAPRHLAFRILP